MSRALRAKEENHQNSLALKKATAEAALNSSNFQVQKMTELLGMTNNSSKRSQILSSYTQEGFSTAATVNESDHPVIQTADGAQSSTQLNRNKNGMQPIGMTNMKGS